MVKLFEKGVYLLNGSEIITDSNDISKIIESKKGKAISKEEAAKNTMTYSILSSHNTSNDDKKLKVRFDA